MNLNPRVFEALEGNFKEPDFEGYVKPKLPYQKRGTYIYTKAHKLYLDGQSANSIRRELHISRDTIYRWCNNNNWKYQREQLGKASSKKTIQSAEDARARLIKMTQFIQGKMLNQLKKTDKEVSVGEGLSAMKFEGELRGLKDDVIQITNTQVTQTATLEVNKILQIAQESNERRNNDPST